MEGWKADMGHAMDGALKVVATGERKDGAT
jgi:hypothetical protein